MLCRFLTRIHQLCCPSHQCLSFIAASHISVPYMPGTMFIQTMASVAHWIVYDNRFFHRPHVPFIGCLPAGIWASFTVGLLSRASFLQLLPLVQACSKHALGCEKKHWHRINSFTYFRTPLSLFRILVRDAFMGTRGHGVCRHYWFCLSSRISLPDASRPSLGHV